MKKALIKKIKTYQTGNVSNYEVYLPAESSVTGKYIRKRFKRNALRHSFGSYHLVGFEKPDVTANQMGHASPTQTFKAYRKAVLESQAQEFWKIRVEAKAWVKGNPKPKAKAKAKATVAEIIPAEKLLAA